MGHHPTGPGAQGHAEDLGFNIFHRHAAVERITASRAVCNSPCYLLAITVCSSGTAAAVANLHSGNTAVSPVILDLGVLTSQFQDFPIRHPIFLGRGIYITIPANILSVTVHYLPVPD